MNQPEDPVLQALSDYKAAVLAKDVDAFVALYAPDVLVFDMWRVWTYKGIAAWREMVAGWFGSLGAERVVVDFDDVQTIVSDDLAVVHTFVTYKAVNADGVDLRSMDNRMSMTLTQKNGAWKIVHQHTSSPIDPDTAQVIFRR